MVVAGITAPSRAELAVRIAQVIEDLFLASLELGLSEGTASLAGLLIAGRGLVEDVQAPARFQKQRDKFLTAAQGRFKAPPLGRGAVEIEPTPDSFFSQGSGKGFVEVRISPHKNFLVGQFMEENLGQVMLLVVNESVQNGILEPTERGVG